MPCNCDHLEPTKWEEESVKVAKHLCYLLPKLETRVPDDVKRAATDLYGNVDKVHIWTAMLCGICNADDDIIYSLDAVRSKEGRRLAAWWDDHQQADLEKQAQ